MSKRLRYVVCDVFTDRQLTGNPLAVFTDARAIDATTMQALARELNLSETTFILPKEGDGDARVRIFTPMREMPFAGHPTLGTAFVLAAPLQRPTVRLETGMGVVPVRFESPGGRIGFGWMTQPLPTFAPFPAGDAILAALGVAGAVLPIEIYDNGPHHVCIVLDRAEAVSTLRPDFARLAALTEASVSVSAMRPDGEVEVRVFAPGSGVAEDPATGLAAGPLGLHLCRHGRAHWGQELVLHQGVVMQRPSRLHVRITGTPERVEMVEVGGEVVLCARGEFILS